MLFIFALDTVLYTNEKYNNYGRPILFLKIVLVKKEGIFNDQFNDQLKTSKTILMSRYLESIVTLPDCQALSQYKTVSHD